MVRFDSKEIKIHYFTCNEDSNDESPYENLQASLPPVDLDILEEF
jgi:hypothetical protein